MNWSNSWNGNAPKAGETWDASKNPPANPKPSNPWDSLDQDALLMLHKEKQDALATMKAEELELRKYIVDRAFPQKEEGTNTLELGNGYQLKATIKRNYKLAENPIVEKCLDAVAKIGNQGAFIADRLVSWTPNFLLTEYRKLEEEATTSEEAKAILKAIEPMLTITEAAPTLTIKEPKKK